MAKKLKLKAKFLDMFGFENNIDISDDCAVLYRRNLVIKNIIFFSNIIYTGLFALLSFGEPSNWVITIICLPVTFLVNKTLKKLIVTDSKDMVKQQIASYFCCFYMFLIAILAYLKMKTGIVTIYSDSSYILIYYSLVVVSLYQDKKLLKNISLYLLVAVTILHFGVTYDVIHANYANSDLFGFIKGLLTSQEFKDIIIRTALLVAFMIVLTSIVSIGQNMQEQRKTELMKRKAVQDDFSKVVIDMFKVTLAGNQIPEFEHQQGNLLAQMSGKLASVLGLSPNDTDNVKAYSVIHLNGQVDLDVDGIDDKDQQFEKLRVQTEIGNRIVRRLELRRKCEDIIRAHEEGWNTPIFTSKTRLIQNDRNSQIILLCDLYITLRSPRNYKRPFSHTKSMELLDGEYKQYFDEDIYDRFVRFENDFDEIFNDYKE